MTTSLKENFFQRSKIKILTPKIQKYRKIWVFKKGIFRPNTRFYGEIWPFLCFFALFWPYFGTWSSQFWRKIQNFLSIDFSRFRRLKCRIERPDWTSRKLRIVERKILYFLIFGGRLLASCGVNFEKKYKRF